ncbi:DUF4297 family anti-phage-associated protein [Vibrio owensii]|uniref:DUF4297 family anti-phage-associated protein n=1 Tax=Vibrio owensii TaxID=696485 RepID=UPI0022DD75AF|nr:DUF4297 family anti-phage-associated protein [Vibrio owensii]MDA0383081.1 hypothetical protein [Vibrio owensii]
MSNRSAIDTIKGYFYQFDLSIDQLLKLDDEDSYIDIERIEDLDITESSEKIAVQCKYYSKTEYNHSVISKPIRQMLSHYKDSIVNNKKAIKYKLYGYYRSGQDKLNWPLSVDEFKENFLIFTEKKKKIRFHEEIKLSDSEIDGFINRVHVDIKASSYDEQYCNIIKLLSKIFSCSNFEAEHYYYNNALNKIREISILDDEEKRRITKREFLSSINKKEMLYNTWFINKIGQDAYFKRIRKQYFTSNGLNTSPYERVFSFSIKDNEDFYEVKTLILKIQHKWSKLSKRDTDNSYCPYIYIHNAKEKYLIELKKALRNEGFKLIDGFDFYGDDFNVSSITQKATFNNEIKIKFFNSESNLYESLNQIIKTKEVYQFYNDSPYLKIDDKSIRKIDIQVSCIKDIMEIC